MSFHFLNYKLQFETDTAYRILSVEIILGKRLLEKPKMRCKDKIKINFRKVGFMDCR
jgi:hypothetical protein